MENQSVKEKIFYWGGITLISSVIIGGTYYIYKSIFGSDEEEKKIIDNDNDSVGNSFILNNTNKKNDVNNINNETNLDYNISNNINSSIFKNNLNNINENENNNIINTININIDNTENVEIQQKDNQKDNPQNSINIFNNNDIFLKSFGINIDESKIFNNNNRLTEEGTVRLIIMMNYLSNKFYLIDNPTLDQKRRALLSNLNSINNDENNINESNFNNIRQMNEEYLTLCHQTLEFRQNSYQIASEKILSSLSTKVNFQEFEEFIKNIDPKQLDKISIKLTVELNDKIFKYDLGFMDINKTKEAYIFYLRNSIDFLKKLKEQQEKNKNKVNQGNEMINEENTLFIFQFMTIKIQMDDSLYEKYHIEEDHLKLLVNKYNLFEDNEISQLKNEWEELNNEQEEIVGK